MIKITFENENLHVLINEMRRTAEGWERALVADHTENDGSSTTATTEGPRKKTAKPSNVKPIVTDEDEPTASEDDESPTEDEGDAPELTLSEVQEAFKTYVKKQTKKLGDSDKAMTRARNILTKFGVKKSADLKPKDWSAAFAMVA